MNKLSMSLIVLLILALTSLCVPFRIQIQQVKATYVRGPITQDTIWTLVDSPLVLSNDVVIYPNVTLTIEPAVEVRFGGNFSIIVEGTLLATSTAAANVRFTSNAIKPAPGDWAAIVLNDANSFASLSNCTIEYATNGLLLETGSVTIESSQVRLNSESGIYIEGSNQALIHNNNFSLNTDGVKVAGNLNPGVRVEQNLFFNNMHSGVSLEADPISNTLIAENTFSVNNYGMQVSTNASTNIANNYFSTNNVGIIYESGNTHQAHFNDIYDNMMGIDVSGNAEVDAQYNYWGDKSGPEHDHLNPYGRGNPVGGNGTNLNFIFFLTRPFEYQDDNFAPIAVLQTDKTLIGPNQNVTFIGTGSNDDGQVDQYYFNFGDGTSTGWITTSLFNHSYTAPGTYTPTLQVKDDFNVTSQNIATSSITVQQNLIALNVAVTPASTSNFGENVSITIYVSTGAGPADNAIVTPLSVVGGSFTPISPLPDSPGYFTTIFTAPNVTRVTNIRIIASASLNGYADGSDYTYLEVLPPLYVQTSINPPILNSEENSTITVYVGDWNLNPVSDATVTVSSSIGGNFSSYEETTDSNGYVTFLFTAPLVNVSTNGTISASAQKAAYLDGQDVKLLMVNPRNLTVEISPSSPTVASGESTVIDIFVTDNSAFVANASVTMSSNYGNFAATTALTDSSGHCAFVFNAPRTRSQLPAVITAAAMKNGYANSVNQTTINVTPEVPQNVGGLPLTTLLLIIIPIIVVVIVIVLIKLKVLSISFKEEEEKE